MRVPAWRTWNEIEMNFEFDHIKSNGVRGRKGENVVFLVMMSA